VAKINRLKELGSKAKKRKTVEFHYILGGEKAGVVDVEIGRRVVLYSDLLGGVLSEEATPSKTINPPPDNNSNQLTNQTSPDPSTNQPTAPSTNHSTAPSKARVVDVEIGRRVVLYSDSLGGVLSEEATPSTTINPPPDNNSNQLTNKRHQIHLQINQQLRLQITRQLRL
jgi:hypothetical protein